jgi:hypothetical protein
MKIFHDILPPITVFDALFWTKLIWDAWVDLQVHWIISPSVVCRSRS